MKPYRQNPVSWPIGRKSIGLVIALILLALYTSVALAAPVTVTDDQGNDDLPGQKDLNFLTVDYTPNVNDVAVSWGWDDTAWSGDNTGDACALFDTDGDGNANYALCITVEDAGVYQATSLFACTADSKSDRCGGPAEDFSFASTGSASVQAVDPFGTTGRATNACSDNSNCLTNDTVGTLSIDKDDVGGGVAKLTNVCSFPSREPNSAPSDCIFTPGSGFLTIVKVANPDDGTDFVFNSSANSQGGDNSWTISGSGTVPLISFAPATTYDLSEVVPSGWDLDSASCVVQSAPTTSTGSFSAANNRIDNFEIREGLETICTFTNLKPGTLIVKKVVVNDNGGTLTNPDFSFSVNSAAAVPFEADGQNDLTVDAGIYTVVEPTVSGYTATYDEDNCSNVNILNGGTATCTITNTDNAPSLILVKQVVNNNGGSAIATDWTLSADGPTDISGTGTVTSGASFDAGAYTLSESGGPAGYTDSSWSCTGGGTLVGNQITLDLGQSATCTIINDDIGAGLTLVKVVNNDNGGTEVASSWTLTASGPTGFSGPGPLVSNGSGFAIGTYTLSESTGPAGYTAGSWVCDGGIQDDDEITLSAGQSATCTIINDDDAPSLTLQKVVTNNNGGTATNADWTLVATGPSTFSGPGPSVSNGAGFDAGTYTLSEFGGPEGYTAGDWSCTGGTQSDDEITLALGESATCTITNNDDAPSLTLKKQVINDDGGTEIASSWTLTASGPTTLTGAGPQVASNTLFKAGTYTLTESTGPAGYTAGSWSCAGGTQSDDEITLALGEVVTCTITNNDQPATLIVVKDVVNDNGGTQSADDFTFQINGGTPITFEVDAQNVISVDAGTYTVTEPSVTGYTTSYSTCDNIVLGNGDTATCTITNNDQSGTLIVQKTVTNDDGGTKDAEDFAFEVNNGSAIPFEVDGENELTVNAGTYTVTEPAVTGYTASYTNCEGIVIPNGGSATCSITNDDEPGTLIVEKVVINDNGGSKSADDFTFKVNNGSAISFDADGENELTVDAGTYTVTEPAVAGYTVSYNTCEGIVIPNGGSATCTITNNDNAPSLTLVKEVVTDNGGTEVASSWTLTASGPTTLTGAGPEVASNALFKAGTYTLTESTGPAGYTAGDWSCVGGSQSGNLITLDLGQSATCTIVNDDDAPSLTLVKEVINNNGGTAEASDWTLVATGPTTLSGVGPTVSSNAAFDAGTYTLSEINGPDGYTASSWSCVGGDQTDDEIVIGLGESITCTITNNDQAATLIVTKITTVASNEEFSFTANASNGLLSGGSFTLINGTSKQFPVDAGTYTVTEEIAAGWELLSSTCSEIAPVEPSSQLTVTIGNGETRECIFTNDPLPQIQVTKTATTSVVIGISGVVTFNVEVANTGLETVTLTSLSDSVFNDLNGEGTCDLTPPVVLGPQDVYQCSFSGLVTGNEGDAHTNTVTAVAVDNESNEAEDQDTETVPFDELPAVEVTKTANVTEVVGTSGPVQFTVVVENIGNVTVTLDSLVDSDFGNLNGKGTCVTGGVIAVGGSYTCAFTETVTGSESLPHSNTVTATVQDKDGNEDQDQDTETVPFDELPAVEVTKTANVTEVVGTTGPVTFTVVVSNAGSVPFTITVLNDSDFGNLDGQGTCVTGAVIPVGGSYTCAFSGTVTGNESTSHHNTVTVTVQDKDGNEDEDQDTETVPFDELPAVEVTKTANVDEVVGTSGPVTFTVVVENVGNVSVTLTSLTDTDFGNLNGKGTCVTGGVIPVGGSYTCAFSETVTGNEATPHSNTVTATVEDKDGNEDSDEDDETVPFDEGPAVDVTKTANVTEVVGTSGPVQFTIVVENIGNVTVTLDSLVDSDFGNLNGKGTCVTGGVIAVGGSYTCTFTETIAGNESLPHSNTVTATVQDKDGNQDQDQDTETVPFDELPEVEVTKTANVTEVVGTSGPVQFTVVVENIGIVTVTLNSLVDSDFGNLNGKGTCVTGGVIAVGGSYTCAFTETVTGSESLPHSNTVTVTVQDKDGNEDQDQDSETVPFDELPAVEVTKTANVTEVVGISDSVTFTIVVSNAGSVPFTITVLNDSDFGNLDGQGTCVTGAVIPVGGSYTCAFSGTVTGSETLPHHNTVTVTVKDKDGNEDEDQDTETVPFDELPQVEVTKTANVTEVVGTSGPVTFTVVVENIGNVSVMLTSLTDSDFGDLNNKGTCVTGGVIPVGGSYTCAFSETVTGNEATPHSNTVTATVEDEDGNEDEDQDTETVPFDELPQVEVTKTANVDEVVGTSGPVTFTVVVENIGNVSVMLTSLTDSDFGDLNGQGTCATGGVIAVGGSYTCAFSETVTGSESLPHNNTVTATVEDKDGNEDSDEDDETVPFDELPSITVTKTANVTEVVGTSGAVQFTVAVENTSNVSVTLTSLSDSDFGDLNGKGTCATGITIPASSTYTCTFTETITGNEATPHSNTVTATVADKDGNEDSDDDDETVPFDELPSVEVTKTANVTEVVGTSGAVTFTVVVQNIGNVPVLIDSLVDSDFGDLNGQGTCATGGIIPVSGSYSCAFSGNVTGSESSAHSNTVTIVVKDEDGNEDEDEDTETVPFDELPQVEVTKTANVTEVVGTSGEVQFTVVVENIGNVAVVLTSLTDSDFGDLNGKGTCVTGGTIAVDGTYTCTFTETVTGSESLPHSNTVTATVEDEDGNEDSDGDDETVPFDELPSVEVTKSANPTAVTGTSGVVTFTVTVQNIGNVPVTLDSLVDSDFGDLNGKGTCVTGGVIAVGNSYTCAFSETVTGSESTPHSNTVTVIVKDEDGNEDEDEDTETVPFDELPQVEVTKTANVTEVVGTSGEVQFTVVVENIGNVAVTLTSLTDSDFGDLDGKGTCATGGAIAVGNSYTCTFTETVTGSESLPHSNTVTATVEDEDGNEDSDGDDETVPFDELPSVEVTKSANPTAVTGTSGVVTFTVTVQNIGNVPVTLDSLVDSDFGDLNGKGTCVTGGVIAVGNSYTCAFSETVTGSESTPHSNTVTVIVKDEDGNEDEEEDEETVPFDELPAVQVSKTANATALTGTSGAVTFTITVENIGSIAVTLTSLTDSEFGNLNGKGTCVTGGIIAVGGSYTCEFAETVTGSESTAHNNVATAVVEDEDGNEASDDDDATVTFEGTPQVEVTKTANASVITGTSGVVTFTIVVQNIGSLPVTLTSLTDSDFGDLNGKGTCVTGGIVAVGGSYTCAFSETVTGSESLPHNNTVTVIVEDEDGNKDEDEDEEIVPFDELPAVEISKTANVTQVVGTSGPVEFTIVVENIGNVAFTLTSLTDSDFGDLNGKGTCVTGGIIPANGSYTCVFTVTITGNEATPHSNTVTVIVEDKDGNTVSDEDDETVPFDELPNSLGNRVWFDNDRNGIQDPGEAGVSGVKVDLYKVDDVALANETTDGSDEEFRTAASVLVATDTTDDNGEYLFTNLEAGSYYVEFATPAGYVFTRYDANGNSQDDVDSDALVPFVSLGVTDDGTEAEVEENTTYSISYTNNDATRQATNVVITTTVPAGTSFVADESSPEWSCTSADEGGICTFTRATMAPNTSATLLFVIMLKDAESFPTTIDLEVNLTHTTPARTQTVALAEGGSNLTLDAGILRLVGNESTPTPTGPTNLPGVEQPKQRLEMFLPSLSVNETAESSAVEEEEAQPEQAQSTFLPSVESQE